MKERDVHALDQLQEPGRALSLGATVEPPTSHGQVDGSWRKLHAASPTSRYEIWRSSSSSPLHHFTTSHCTRTPLPASAWRVAALPRCSSPSSSSSWRGRASGPEPQDSADSDWFLRLENGAITCNNYPKLTFPMDLWIFNDVHHLESMICEAVLKSAHFRIRQIIEVWWVAQTRKIVEDVEEMAIPLLSHPKIQMTLSIVNGLVEKLPGFKCFKCCTKKWLATAGTQVSAATAPDFFVRQETWRRELRPLCWNRNWERSRSPRVGVGWLSFAQDCSTYYLNRWYLGCKGRSGRDCVLNLISVKSVQQIWNCTL